MNSFSSFEILLSSITLIITLGSIVYHVAAIYASVKFSKEQRPNSSNMLPPVTVVKPLYGVDSYTYAALDSFCRQKYPKFEIIFVVSHQEDPAVRVVDQLIQDNPSLDLKLVINDKRWGANNKVSNMANAIEMAKYSIYVLADSDVYVGENYLKKILEPFEDEAVGMVTTMYRTQPRCWMAAFEALSTSTEFFPSVLLARQLEGMAFAFGATVVIKQQALQAIGGMALIADYLADDYKIGECTAKAGFKVVLSNYVVEHTLNTRTFKELFIHQLRWARGNRFSRPWGTLGMVFIYGTLSSLICLVLNPSSILAQLLLIVTWMLRYALGWLVGIYILNDKAANSLLWLAPIRDILSFTIWLTSWFGSEVRWNSRTLKLSRDGQISEVRKLGVQR
jgi:ceramide glucosyltransferase